MKYLPTKFQSFCLVCLAAVGAVSGQSITVTYPGRPYLEAVGGSSGFFQTGQPADIMLCGVGFNKTGGSLLFNHLGGIGSDGTRVVLTDRNNNRVLIWLAPPSGNTPPDLVLGQPDFTQNNPGSGSHQMNWPVAVSVSATGRVAVTDANNDRVLLWNSFPTSNGQPADLAIRLSQFANPVPGRPPLGWPWGVWTDGTRLVVSATQGSAMLFWNSWPAASNSPPSFILTNAAFGTPRAITSDGTFLAVEDHNAALSPAPPGAPPGHATFFWNTFPTSATAPHSFVLGGRYRGGMVGTKLVLLGEGRMRIWNSPPQNDATPPVQDLNGPWGSDCDALAVAGGRVLTMDENQNAILGFNSLPTAASGSATPHFTIGSPAVGTNTLLTEYFIQNPCPVSDGTSLFVCSDFHQRLCVWRRIPDESGAWPDVVYQLPGGGWDSALFGGKLVLATVGRIYIWDNLPLYGELPSRTITGKIGNTNLTQLRGVALDSSYFYVADYNSQQVHVFAGIPNASDDPLVTISPGGRPGRISSDGTWLAVPVEGQGGPHSVKLYRVSDLPAVTAPARSIQPPQVQLNLPQGCTVSHGRLFIADTSFNRVLGWSNVANAVAGQAPDLVLGEKNLTDTKAEIGRDKLFMPAALSFDGQRLWAGEFKFSSRLLRFRVGASSLLPVYVEASPSLENGIFRVRLMGQPGQRLEFLRSENLTEWNSAGFRSFTGSGTLEFWEPVSAGQSRLFLKAVSY